LIVRHGQRGSPINEISHTTNTKSAKMEFDGLPNCAIDGAIEARRYLGLGLLELACERRMASAWIGDKIASQHSVARPFRDNHILLDGGDGIDMLVEYQLVAES
jgi:hypothetical protein